MLDEADLQSKSAEELQALCLQLQSRLQEQSSELLEKEDTIAYLQEQLALLKSRRFLSQSEQLKTIQGQLFDEAELEQAIQETEAALKEAEDRADAALDKYDGAETDEQTKSAPQKPKRKPLPAHLRRIEYVVDVSDEDKQLMADEWTLVGHEISEQLAVHQREYYVKQYKRAKYVRNKPSDDEVQQAQDQLSGGILLAPRSNVILPKALADSSLLADIITSKFIDAVSFYRTEKILAREGVEIGYSTLCHYPIQLAERLAPLMPLLFEQLASGPLWHIDETTAQVMQEVDRTAQQKSYFWAIRGGEPDKPVVLFHYHPRRNFDALEDWLKPCLNNFSGVIVTDEHKPYNKLTASYPNIIAHGGCWAHLRRKFSDAAKGRRSGSDAHKVLQQIAILYRLDGRADKLEGEIRFRHDVVKPHVEKIKALFDKLAPGYLKQGLMQKAIGYALNQWDKFVTFLDHPAMPLDNNPIEQAIRPFTLGRRNWLFSGSPKGANASAFMYSLIETAKANGWEPKAYLNELFSRYPHAKNDAERKALLPMFLKSGI